VFLSQCNEPLNDGQILRYGGGDWTYPLEDQTYQQKSLLRDNSDTPDQNPKGYNDTVSSPKASTGKTQWTTTHKYPEMDTWTRDKSDVPLNAQVLPGMRVHAIKKTELVTINSGQYGGLRGQQGRTYPGDTFTQYHAFFIRVLLALHNA